MISINEILEELNDDRRKCIQAKKYISTFGFTEIDKYLEGRIDCLAIIIEKYYQHENPELINQDKK